MREGWAPPSRPKFDLEVVFNVVCPCAHRVVGISRRKGARRRSLRTRVHNERALRADGAYSMKVLAVSFLFLASVAGLWAATEHVAAALHYAPALGPPWMSVASVRIYPAWGWLAWSRVYAHGAPIAFRNASGLTTLGALIGCAGAALASVLRPATAPSRAHGSSRWATTEEIRSAGLLRDAGVVLCQTDDAAFRHDGRPARKDRRDSSTRLGAPHPPRRSRARLLLRADALAAKASASSSRRCSPGRIRSSSTTSRRRTGR